MGVPPYCPQRTPTPTPPRRVGALSWTQSHPRNPVTFCVPRDLPSFPDRAAPRGPEARNCRPAAPPRRIPRATPPALTSPPSARNIRCSGVTFALAPLPTRSHTAAKLSAPARRRSRYAVSRAIPTSRAAARTDRVRASATRNEAWRCAVQPSERPRSGTGTKAGTRMCRALRGVCAG